MSTAVNQRKVVTSLQNAICDLTESELKKFQTYKRIYEESVKEILSQFPGISELIKGQNSSRLYKYVFGGILRFIAEFTKHNMSPVTMEDVLTYLAYKDIDIMIYCSKKAESFKRFKELIDTLFKHDATIEYHGRDYGSKPPSEFEEDVDEPHLIKYGLYRAYIPIHNKLIRYDILFVGSKSEERFNSVSIDKLTYPFNDSNPGLLDIFTKKLTVPIIPVFNYKGILKTVDYLDRGYEFKTTEDKKLFVNMFKTYMDIVQFNGPPNEYICTGDITKPSQPKKLNKIMLTKHQYDKVTKKLILDDPKYHDMLKKMDITV